MLRGITARYVATLGSIPVKLAGHEVEVHVVGNEFPIEEDGILGSPFFREHGKSNGNADALSRNPPVIEPQRALPLYESDDSTSSKEEPLYIPSSFELRPSLPTITTPLPTSPMLPSRSPSPDLNAPPPTPVEVDDELLTHSTNSDVTSQEQASLHEVQQPIDNSITLIESRDTLTMRADHKIIFLSENGTPRDKGAVALSKELKLPSVSFTADERIKIIDDKTFKIIAMIKIISLLVISIQFVNSLIGFDCGGRHLNVTTLSLLDIGTCDFTAKQPKADDVYIQLLQLSEYETTEIIQCKIELLRTIHHCGMHSHISAVHNGYAEFLTEITHERCSHMLREGTVKIGETIIDGLLPNSTTRRSITIAGTVRMDGTCKAEKPAILNSVAHKILTNSKTGNSEFHLHDLLDEEDIERIAESAAHKIWNGFLTFGTASAGIIGIYLIFRIIKFIVDVILQGCAIHNIYGCSFHLLGACLGSLTHLLITRTSAESEQKSVITLKVTGDELTSSSSWDN
ncbi:hypothetical protein KPH14_012224 [Odynerus spinipes]|uniref:Uncharacterized protein n=1 Tax=Odynerus spinipes TaxID=1348599 RepID=A0AAD9RMQ5_9HYME|nr:hypothetical protein KPH14_012224 [Odynerus spinipes]